MHLSRLFRHFGERMAVHEHCYSYTSEQTGEAYSGHVQDGGGLTDLSRLLSGQSSAARALRLAVTRTWDLCCSPSSTLGNIRSLHRHRKFLISRAELLNPQRGGKREKEKERKVAHCSGVIDGWETIKHWNYNKKENAIQVDKNQPWKIICYFPRKASICTLQSCSESRSGIPNGESLSLFEWMRRCLMQMRLALLLRG